MAMVRFAVCDDEQDMSNHISDKLRIYYPGKCEIKTYTDGTSLISDCLSDHFDALFLDIGMPGLDGIELAQKIRENDPYVKIVFVTNKEELAHMGYKYGAFRYVRKKNLEQELRETAESLKEHFDSFDESIILKTPMGEVIRPKQNIKYFEVYGHDVIVVYNEHEEQVCGTMKEYDTKLKNSGFIRIHKSYLVNYRYIDSIEKNDVKLTCGKKLPLSRNRIGEVRKKMQEFLINIKVTATSYNPDCH